MARTLVTKVVDTPSETIDVAELYDAHADFVWRSLYRLGVPRADLPDLLQDVFVTLHRRRSELQASSPRGLLWSIAVGRVRNHRRRAHRSETLSASPPDVGGATDPERALEQARSRERGRRLLESLDPEKRAVFVMFEVEGLSGKEIATKLSLPLGTVHSRLHAARRELTRALEEER